VIFLFFPEYGYRLMIRRGGCQKVSDLRPHLPKSRGEIQLHPHCVDFHCQGRFLNDYELIASLNYPNVFGDSRGALCLECRIPPARTFTLGCGTPQVQHVFRTADSHNHVQSFLSAHFSVRGHDLILYVNERDIKKEMTLGQPPSSDISFELKAYCLVMFRLLGTTYSLPFPEAFTPEGRRRRRDGTVFDICAMIQTKPGFMKSEITDLQLYDGPNRLNELFP
jgi:hypothetical protein